MELKCLSNTHSQYSDAGLEEAYHIVYYIPSGDVTNWTSRVKSFKWSNDKTNYEAIIEECATAFKIANLKFDYVFRVLSSNETVAQNNSRLKPLAKRIAEVTRASYIPQILKKRRTTTSLHSLPDLASRKAEIKEVFEINQITDLNLKDVLIIDDISTACVTVAEMIKTLKKKWPLANFYLFCIARTSHNTLANQNI